MAHLSLNANTRVDTDPNMSDALWLRALAQRLTKKEHVNPPFPDGGEFEGVLTGFNVFCEWAYGTDVFS